MWDDVNILCFEFIQGMHYAALICFKWIILSRTIRKVPPLLTLHFYHAFFMSPIELWQVRERTGRFCALSVALRTPKNFLQGLWTDDSCPFREGQRIRRNYDAKHIESWTMKNLNIDETLMIWDILWIHCFWNGCLLIGSEIFSPYSSYPFAVWVPLPVRDGYDPALPDFHKRGDIKMAIKLISHEWGITIKRRVHIFLTPLLSFFHPKCIQGIHLGSSRIFVS